MSLAHEEGDLIEDRYRLEKYIGEGGVSKVWESRDEESGKRVVIKHPNYDSENDPGIVKDSIEREMDVLDSIEGAGGHPNLMGLVGRTTTRGHPAMVVEHISGTNLFSEVKRRNGFTNAEEVRQVGVALCNAMSFLHENEIMYRDLKPDNVMIQPDGTPVLIDFNTAKGFVTDSDDSSGTVIPNPTYKPPELNNDPDLVGYRQGPWSDVYSIGKTLLFMFSASAPRSDGVDPRDFPGSRSVPAYLAESIERATQAHKDDRYRNATVFERVLANQSPQPPAVSSVAHLGEEAVYDIYPGDTIGRATSDGPRPSVSIEDPDSYISAVQVQFDSDGDDWSLRDRSLNGTWINRDDDWHRVLSPRGKERLIQQSDESEQELAALPAEMKLAVGDRIALVHPDYGVWFEFRGENQ